MLRLCDYECPAPRDRHSTAIGVTIYAADIFYDSKRADSQTRGSPHVTGTRYLYYSSLCSLRLCGSRRRSSPLSPREVTPRSLGGPRGYWQCPLFGSVALPSFRTRPDPTRATVLLLLLIFLASRFFPLVHES